MSEEREYAGPWINARLQCDVCEAWWHAVYPSVCMRLECPKCGVMQPAPIVMAEFKGFNLVVLPFADRDEALGNALYHLGDIL